MRFFGTLGRELGLFAIMKNWMLAKEISKSTSLSALPESEEMQLLLKLRYQETQEGTSKATRTDNSRVCFFLLSLTISAWRRENKNQSGHTTHIQPWSFTAASCQ